MPVFIAKYNERPRNSGAFGEESKELIGTIKVPKNLSLLTERLPASQYDQEPPVAAAASPGLPQIAETNDEETYVPVINARKQLNAQ